MSITTKKVLDTLLAIRPVWLSLTVRTDRAFHQFLSLGGQPTPKTFRPKVQTVELRIYIIYDI